VGGLTRVFCPGQLDARALSIISKADVLSSHATPSLLEGVTRDFGLFRHNHDVNMQSYFAATDPENSSARLSENRDLAARASRIAAPSSYSGALDAAALSRPVDTVYPFVDAVSAEYVRPAQDERALYIGRVVTRKGLGWIIDQTIRGAFSWEWSWASPTAKSEPQTELERDVLRFTCVGAPSGPAQVAQIISRFPVVICPYTDEPFGMVVAEALALGTRVVAFDEGGPAEIASLLGGEGITLVPRYDVEQFDYAVASALTLGPLSQVLRHRAVETFSFASSVRQYHRHLLALGCNS
jgi:glycosyltransferase involved in cell wall biosynthesis